MKPQRYVVYFRGLGYEFPYEVKDTESPVPFTFAAFFNEFDANEYCAIMNLVQLRNERKG